MRMSIEGLGRLDVGSVRRAPSRRPPASPPAFDASDIGPAAITAISPAARALAARSDEPNVSRGAFVADGREVRLDVKSSASGYDNDIMVSIDGGKSFSHVGVDDDGSTVSLGKLAKGTRVMVAISNGEGFFVAGDPSQNPDGLEHARVEATSEGAARFSFEDLLGGGDMDFDDAVVELRSVDVSAEEGLDRLDPEAQIDTADLAPAEDESVDPATDTDAADAADETSATDTSDELVDVRDLDTGGGTFSPSETLRAALRTLSHARASRVPPPSERRDITLESAARLYETLLVDPRDVAEPSEDLAAEPPDEDTRDPNAADDEGPADIDAS